MDETWLEGRISVEAAIRGGNRPVTAVYIRQGKWSRQVREFLRFVKKAAIPVEYVDDAFIAEHVKGQSHGGIVALVGPRQFEPLGSLLQGHENPFVVMLDGIEDPFNFGQAIRALYAAGASGLVIRPRTWLSAAATVSRASAGASELMPTTVAETAQVAADFYRAHGLQIACMTKDTAVSIYDTDLAGPLFLLVGGERRGITRSFLQQADLRLKIPYGRKFSQSLGAAASAAVIGCEVLRQRSQTQN